MTAKAWRQFIICFLLPFSVFSCAIQADETQPLPPVNGVLRVHPQNPRYFSDGSGRAIYLTGSHTWNNLVDVDSKYPPKAFDFEAYLEFLESHGHNFIRLWTLELTQDYNNHFSDFDIASPHPWPRTGPGLAVDGLPKFDLSQFNEAYFARLRERVVAAGERGMYVSVMLFEGWGVQFSSGRRSHPFLGNNINGVTVSGDPWSIHTLEHPDITALQEAYVKKVIDTVNDLDNVLYEIVNEAGDYSSQWQYHMIRFVKDYQKGKPKQHLVGMTFQMGSGDKRGTNQTLFDSTADWISPGNDGATDYRNQPPPATGDKLILNDTDHLWGIGGDWHWVWKSFMRAHHVLYMDEYEPPDTVSNHRHENAPEIRKAMGQTREYAERVNLVSLTPRPELASSTFVLASSDELLVYVPDSSALTLELSKHEGTFAAEWFNPVSEQILVAPSVQAGSRLTLEPPFSNEAVLYLKKAP